MSARLGSYPINSAEDVVFNSYNAYCHNKQITPFPIHPLVVACFLRTVTVTQRLIVASILEQAGIKTAPAFDKLGFLPDVRIKVNLAAGGWALWEKIVQEGNGSLTEWRVIRDLLSQPVATLSPPQFNNYLHQQPFQPPPTSTHQSIRRSSSRTAQSHPTNVQNVDPTDDSTSRVLPALAPTPTRKRARSPTTIAHLDPKSAKAELEFYNQVEKLKTVMVQLVSKRKALASGRAQPLAIPTATAAATRIGSSPAAGQPSSAPAAPTLPQNMAVAVVQMSRSNSYPNRPSSSTLAGQRPARHSRDGFPPLPAPSRPPSPAVAAPRAASTSGVVASTFKSAAPPSIDAWSDYTPTTVPLQPEFTIPAPAHVGSSLALAGKRKLFTPSSVLGDSPITTRRLEPSLRTIMAKQMANRPKFESTQAALTVAVGAKVGLGHPSALQMAQIRPTTDQHASPQSSPHPNPKASPPGQASALGVTGLPTVSSPSVQRPARASASTGMTRAGSNGGGSRGQTPSMSNVHPLARLYGQISQQERKGVLQMVASRSPSCSQENSPRTGPPASLGGSPLVKYVEMGIEIAQAAVKERQKVYGHSIAIPASGLGLAGAGAGAGQTKGKDRMEELVGPPLVPVPTRNGSAPPASVARPIPLKSVPLLRPTSPEPEPEPAPELEGSSPPALLKYAPPSTPSASPPLLTKVQVWSTPGFLSRPSDAAKRAGAVTTRGVGPECVARKGMKDMPAWVQRASKPAIPFAIAKK